MDNDQDDITLQRYLDGDMTEQERMAFENRLREDQPLKSQVAEYRLLARGIRYQARHYTWQKVQQLEAEAAENAVMSENHFNMTKRRFWLAAAAIVLCLIGFLYFWNQPSAPREVFAEYFAPYPALAYAPDRSDTTYASLRKDAFAAYSNSEYAKAIDLFNNILTQEDEPIIWFYLGNAYLAQEDFPEAIAAFQQFLTYNTELDAQARWYLGLSYLGEGEKQKAKELFESTQIQNSSYHTKAKNIIDNL